MKVTLLFTAKIQTAETGSSIFEVKFERDVEIDILDYENTDELRKLIFDNAREFVDALTSNLSVTYEYISCKGITHVLEIKYAEALDLAKACIYHVQRGE